MKFLLLLILQSLTPHTYVVTDTTAVPPKQVDSYLARECLSAGVFDGKIYCMPEATPPPGLVTVSFDPAPGPCCALNGVYQGIDFGQGQWNWEGPFLGMKSNNIYVSTPSNSRQFTFANPQVLVSMDVATYAAGSVTITSDAGETVTEDIPLNQVVTVKTGFTLPAKVITLTYSQGMFKASFDNIVKQ